MDNLSEWICKIRTGDARAFEQLLRLYCQPLIHFVCRYVRDTSTAENLVQEVFLAIWTHRSQLDPARSIKTYLYTAARNQALKHLRHSQVEQRSAADIEMALPHPQTPEDERQRREIGVALAQAIEALSEKARIIFSMNRFDQLSYAEIAEIQGISIKTVETQMGRALKFLRTRLVHLR